VGELGLDVGENQVGEGGLGGRGGGGLVRGGRFCNVTGLVFEFVNLIPVHSVRDDVLWTGLFTTHGALRPFRVDDAITGALVTRRPCAAGHHDSITEKILADRTQ